MEPNTEMYDYPEYHDYVPVWWIKEVFRKYENDKVVSRLKQNKGEL